MTPIDQTTFAGETPPDDPTAAGNCLQAAVASLLDMPMNAVPHFASKGDQWWPTFMDFARSVGCWIAITEVPVDGALGLMSGRSPRGEFRHCVVARGAEVVHDPHPSRAGVIDPDEWRYFVPLDPRASRPRRPERFSIGRTEYKHNPALRDLADRVMTAAGVSVDRVKCIDVGGGFATLTIFPIGLPGSLTREIPWPEADGWPHEVAQRNGGTP